MARLPRVDPRLTLAESRRLVRIATRDPEHLAERLTLYGARHLAEASRDWARDERDERPDATLAQLAADLQTQSARVARIDGAISGTPFLIAFVPGYVAYLWQEGRMVLRTAALHGRDPASAETSAEVLVLRGVHADVTTAAAALDAASTPLPERPDARRPARTWVRSVHVLLIFGGFLGPPDPSAGERAHPRLRTAIALTAGAVVWAITWIFPVTFMLLMAWSCEAHTRELGRDAQRHYSGAPAGADDDAARRARRRSFRGALLTSSVALPILFVAFVDHLLKHSSAGRLGAVAALVAVSLVIATSVVARR